MTRVVLFVFVGAAAFLGSASVVSAQAAHTAIEVRSAFGASNYLHGDLGYTAPTLLVAVRLGSGPLVVEPEFTVARYKKTDTFGGGTTTTSTDRFQAVAVNVLGRWGDRVSAFAGGGVGAYSEHFGYQVSGPQSYKQTRQQGPRLGAQAVAGVDVPVAARIKAFAQFRYEMRSFDDPGGGSVLQGLGGIAIGLW